MDVLYLANFTEAIPQLAAWFREEWPDEIGGDAETGLHRCMNTNEIPIGLVAVDNGNPVGIVQLLSTSMSSHPHLKPWIGGLYVHPPWRHRGAIAASVELDGLRVTKGEEKLTLYQFNTMTAKHYFCANCGIYTHHQRRCNPSQYAFNVACLEDIDPSDLGEVPVTDGINHPSDR